ncbi:DUF6192 family protein [Streptomyces klenkii]|uniref:DUF6192 family protein n=1 Tax=Streptomyces klenkii TaxID=1420899 RepID=UPI003439B44F
MSTPCSATGTCLSNGLRSTGPRECPSRFTGLWTPLEDQFELIINPPQGITQWTDDKALRVAGRLPHRPLTKAEKLDRVRVLPEQDENAAEAVSELIKRPDGAHRVMSNDRAGHIRAHTPAPPALTGRCETEKGQAASPGRNNVAAEMHALSLCRLLGGVDPPRVRGAL